MAVVAPESPYYQALNNGIDGLFVEGLRQWELSRLGAMFDEYIIDDLSLIARRYKAYIFLNAFYVSADLRRAIRRKLEQDRATAVWFYAPGYIDDQTCSIENIRELTGLRLGYANQRQTLEVKLAARDHPLLRDVGGTDTYGLPTEQMRGAPDNHWPKLPPDRYTVAPVFYADDPDADVLGRVTHSEFAFPAYAACRTTWHKVLRMFRLPRPEGPVDKTCSRTLWRCAVASMSANEACGLCGYHGRGGGVYRR